MSVLYFTHDVGEPGTLVLAEVPEGYDPYVGPTEELRFTPRGNMIVVETGEDYLDRYPDSLLDYPESCEFCGSYPGADCGVCDPF